MGFIKQAKFLNYFKSKDGKLIERLSNKITTYVVDADSLIFTENKLVPEENRMIYYFKEGIAKCFFTIKHSEEILSLSNV